MKRTLSSPLAILLAAGSLLPAAAHGAILTWGNAAGGSAATPGNWSPSQIPAAADALTFNTNANFTVTFNASVTASTSHTYKRGTVTLNFTSPHSTGTFVRVGDVAADNARVVVTAGTLHASGGLTIGNAGNSAGTVIVEDEGTLLDTTGAGTDIVVGNFGNGTLNITDGATVTVVDDFIIGSAATGEGHVTVTGGGSFPIPIPSSTLNVQNAGSDLIVGQSGSASLDVLAGGRVVADEMLVGREPGSDGTVNVGGAGILGLGSSITIATSLRLGDNPAVGASAGAAFFTVNNGGIVTVTGTTRVGDAQGVGAGTLTINQGGALTTGSLILTDTGGFLNLLGGQLTVDGGTLSARNDQIIINSTVGSPVVNLHNGASCTLSAPAAPFEALVLGRAANGGRLDVATGSTLTISAGDVILGDLAGGEGRLQVQLGAQCSMPAARTFTIGDAGTGNLAVGANGHLTTGSARLGALGSGVGTALVTGMGARWDVNGTLAIGGTAAAAGGTGTATITPGGTIHVTSGGSATTSVRVWGAGDSLTVNTGGALLADGEVLVDGDFTLAGGTVQADKLTLRTNSATFNLAGTVLGMLRLSAGLSTVTLTGDLTLGTSAPGSASLANSGLFEIGNHTLTALPNMGSLNDLNNCRLGPSGRIVSDFPLRIGLGFTLSGDGIVSAPIDNFGSILSQGTGLTFTRVLSGVGTGISGARITFDAGGGFTGQGVFSSATPITSDADSVITATGDLTMGASNSASGFVSNGLIVIHPDARVTLNDSNGAPIRDVEFPAASSTSSLRCDQGLTISAAGTITGTGQLITAVQAGVTNSGTIDPGTDSASGLVSIAGQTFLNPTSRVELDIFNAASSDKLHILSRTSFPNGVFDPPVHTASHITLGGTLVVRVAPDHVPFNGETHQLISTLPAPLSPFTDGNLLGNFAEIQRPPRWMIQVRNGGNFAADGVFAVFCSADFNDDGFRNPDDLADFITCFFLDVQFPGFCPLADFNSDGFRNPDDLADFITAFFVGCG